MSFIQRDRNNEQMPIPLAGTSGGFEFEGKNVPKPGEGLDELIHAVHGSP